MKRIEYGKFIFAIVVTGWTTIAQETVPFMTIRLWTHHHDDTNLLEQTLEALKRQKACCDEVWFCTESGKPPMAVHRASAARMAAAAEKMQGIGIVPSLQVGSTIGHADSVKDRNYSGMTWSGMVGWDGQQARTLSCPRQKAFLDYVREECAVYAVWKPACIWLDDDLRLTYHGPFNGCYCETCLNLFGQQEKRTFSRAQLLQAMDSDTALRERWVRFGLESLGGVGRAAAEGARAVSPETRIGFQNIGRLEKMNLSDWSPVFRAMAEASGHPACSRCGNGFYSDANPRGMLEKGYDIARLVARTPLDCVGRICPEIETYPHLATRKSNHGLAVESALYLAMGTGSLSYSVIASAKEPMDWYEANWLHELATCRSFFEAYAKDNHGAALAGVDPFLGKTFGAWREGSRKDLMKWMKEPYDGFVAPLSVLGIPFCPDSPASCCSLLEGQNARLVCSNDFDRLYAKGILADSSAAAELAALGAPKLDAKEIKHMLPGTPMPDGNVSAWAARLCQTARGGRAVLLERAFTAEITSAERLGLLRLLDWASNGKMPVLVETMSMCVVVPRVDSNGTLRSVAALNATIGEQRPVLLRLRGCPAGCATAVWQAMNAEPENLPLTWQEKDALVRLPPLAAWNIGWLRFH